MRVLTFPTSDEVDVSLLHVYEARTKFLPKELLWAFCRLDLDLCRKVELHNGRVWLRSFGDRSALARLFRLQTIVQIGARRPFFSLLSSK